MAISITMIVLALAGSAFISAAEAALLSARMSNIEHLAGRGNKRAQVVMSVLDRYENFFATILLFGNLFNIIVAVAASNLLVATIADGETTLVTNILATALATILVYTVGELTPKTIGAKYPEAWSLAVGHIVSALIWIARPVVVIFTLPIFVMQRLGILKTQQPIYTSGELSLIIDRSQEQEVFDHHHGEMIDKLLKFGFKDLRDTEESVHTSDIISLNISDTLQTFLEKYREHEASVKTRHNLMPGFVVENCDTQHKGYWYERSEIAGVVYIKDVIKTIATDGLNPDAPIVDMMEDAIYSNDFAHLDDVLKDMIRTGHEIVLSVNDSGRVNGMVTLKGILELVRGDDDDRALLENPIEKPDERTVIVPGALSVERTRKETGLEIPLSPQYETIAGFFVEKLQRAPEVGDAAAHGETMEMEVVKMAGNRVQVLKMTRTATEQ